MAEKLDETPLEKPKSGKVWAVLIAVLILVVAGDITLRAMTYFKTTGNHGWFTKAAAAAAEKSQKPEIKSTMNLDTFLVNLADKEDIRFVKAQFQLGMTEENEEVTKNPVVLAATRDAIISLLTSKTSDQVMTPQGKDKLREEIMNRVNAILPKGKVCEVFIVDFVVQL